MHGLDDPRAKIRRAKQHLAQLDVERDEWVESRPYYVTGDPNADKTLWTFSVYRFEDDIKPETDVFGLLVGDYVHNLRSALDQLVWKLVTVANNITPKSDREVSFPIITTHPRDFWNKPIIARQELTFEQALFLEGFQPYRTLNPIHPHVLTALQDLWNTDKHKLITVTRVTVHKNGPVFKFTDTREIDKKWDSSVALEGDAEIAWVTVEVVGANPKVEMEWLPVEVAVGESGRLIEDLPRLSFVVEEIVENCARFFP